MTEHSPGISGRARGASCSTATAALMLLVFLLPSGRVWGCLNRSGTTEEGKRTSESGHVMALRHSLRTGPEALRKEGELLESRGAYDLRNRSDYAVALILQGRYPDAIGVLQDTEKQSPGDYSVAANLGTALELTGRDEEALKWIQEGIRRNADSHLGTEWLHVKILEAKIQAAKNPGYFKDHSVLDLDHSRIARGATNLIVGGQARDLAEVNTALWYQLKERLQFVKTNDAPVASLLFDYAAILAATSTLEAAKEVLKMAVDFGYPVEKVQPLLARYERIILLANLRMWAIHISIALLVAAFFVYAVKRRWITLTVTKTPCINPLRTSRLG